MRWDFINRSILRAIKRIAHPIGRCAVHCFVKPWNCSREYESSDARERSTEITLFYGTEVTCNNRWLTAISFSLLSPLAQLRPLTPFTVTSCATRSPPFSSRGFVGTHLITSSNGFHEKVPAGARKKRKKWKEKKNRLEYSSAFISSGGHRHCQKLSRTILHWWN